MSCYSQDPWPSSRSRLLTNLAAEYLETRGADILGMTPTEEAQAPEFVPGIDRFMSSRRLTDEYHFIECASRKQLFQVTLEKFCKRMEKRRDKDPGFEIRKENEWTFQDVWTTAEKVAEEYQNADHVRKPMNVIVKAFRKVGENSLALERLLAFVPDDTLGSVICGGFTIILGALRRSHDVREGIYSALKEIPEKLQRIRDWLGVHSRSPALLGCADGVLAAIFMTLEKILGEITKNVVKKAVIAIIKGDRYVADVQEALKTLEDRVENFKSQASLCDAQRLGRVEECVSYMCNQTKKDEATMAKGKTAPKECTVDDRAPQIQQQEELQIAVYNATHKLLEANKKELMASLEIRNPAVAAPSTGPSSVDPWLQELQRSDTTSTAHCEECLRNSWGLTIKKQDSLAWMMSSGELRGWLRAGKSSTLVVESETRPDELMNPVTLAAALLVQTLAANARFPVLSFFCGLRTNDAYDEQLSGPVGMLNCLNAQFLTYLKTHSPGVFIPRLGDRKFRQKSQKHVAEALALLEVLVEQLSPGGDAVVVVIDSACRLVGPSSGADKAIRGILNIAKKAAVIFKVLITDMMSNRPIERREVTKLFLPDYIDGERQGLNMDVMQSEAGASVAVFTDHPGEESSADESSCSSSNVTESSEDDD